MFELRRTSGGALSLTREHEKIAAPRKGVADFSAFRSADYDAATLDRAASAWQERALQEYHSLALFTQLSSQLHVIGAPLDWSGAFARMIEDEVRHTDLCLRMCEALGRPAPPAINDVALHLFSAAPLRIHVRHVVVAAFCIGETVSGLMFKRALRAATVPLARDVVSAILVDETFHGELGWELIALLMRGIDENERRAVADRLAPLFVHYAKLCGATPGREWARAPEPMAEGVNSEQHAERSEGANFGTLTERGYARAFYDAMEEDVVPGLVAVGLSEATTAYTELVAKPA